MDLEYTDLIGVLQEKMVDQYRLVGRTPVEEPDNWVFIHWFGTAERRVRVTQIKDDVEVSTVFLGFNHNPHGDGPPVLFETMILGAWSDWQVRSCTWDEAERVHSEAVSVACGWLNTPPSETVQVFPDPKAPEPPEPSLVYRTWYEHLADDSEGSHDDNSEGVKPPTRR